MCSPPRGLRPVGRIMTWRDWLWVGVVLGVIIMVFGGVGYLFYQKYENMERVCEVVVEVGSCTGIVNPSCLVKTESGHRVYHVGDVISGDTICWME